MVQEKIIRGEKGYMAGLRIEALFLVNKKKDKPIVENFSKSGAAHLFTNAETLN